MKSQDKCHPVRCIQERLRHSFTNTNVFQDGKLTSCLLYVSRSLTETEQWVQTDRERELLSDVFALETFQYYLYGYIVTVQTDHQLLVHMCKKSIVSNSPHLQRLLLRLSHYDVEIEYLKGKENVIADALSRVSPQPVHESNVDRDLLLFKCLQKKALPIQQV